MMSCLFAFVNKHRTTEEKNLFKDVLLSENNCQFQENRLSSLYLPVLAYFRVV